MFTVTEAARLYQVDRQKIARKVRDGELETVENTSPIKITVESLTRVFGVIPDRTNESRLENLEDRSTALESVIQSKVKPKMQSFEALYLELKETVLEMAQKIRVLEDRLNSVEAVRPVSPVSTVSSYVETEEDARLKESLNNWDD